MCGLLCSTSNVCDNAYRENATPRLKGTVNKKHIFNVNYLFKIVLYVKKKEFEIKTFSHLKYRFLLHSPFKRTVEQTGLE